MVSRLEPGLYHADGQILEEVYVYGSFVQSKMYNAGVRCSDCHEPHSLELNAPGNALCASCHSVAIFDTPDHYFHEVGSSGAQCVECHMPETTYMLVDPRRDHSMRVPSPALAEEIDAPDACTMCHTDQSSGWAAAVVENWYGPRDEQAEFAARAIHASREGRPGSGAALTQVASDLALSGIVRATALSMSSGQPSSQTLVTVEAGTNDPNPAVRLGALAALDGVSPEARVPIAFRLLRDSIRSVRIEAARVLAPVPTTTLTESQQALLGEVFQEYIDAQLVNADRAEAHTNIGNLYAQRGIADAAEIAYRDAIRVDASFAPAYLNLADIYRALGRETEGEATLRDGLARVFETPSLHHALGLLLIRRGETKPAMEELRRAVELAPDNPRMAYVLGVALNSEGDWPAARRTIDSALASSPWDRDLLTLMATALRDQSETEEAMQYAVRLAEVAPEDRGVIQLLAELKRDLAGG
jgi:tetratricopeptide (TPR) repeat protein